MRITVVYSLPTRRALATPYAATDEDTRKSAVAAAKELSRKGADVELVSISEDTLDDVATIETDCIFNLIEWSGLDTPLAIDAVGRIESLGIPFTSVSSNVFAKVADKIDMKKALRDAGLPTPNWQVFGPEGGSSVSSPGASFANPQSFRVREKAIRSELRFPVIVKPLFEHCSIGLTYEAVVEDPLKLEAVVKERIDQYKQPVFAEEFIIGREFQVTVLDRASGLTALPPAEIVFEEQGSRAFLTYASRWIEGHPEYETSSVELAKLTPGLARGLADVSKKAFAALDFRDYSRLDIRVRNSGNPQDSRNWQDDVYILEANANPGLEDDPAYGMSVSFHAAGMTFADFLWEIVQSAMRRA